MSIKKQPKEYRDRGDYPRLYLSDIVEIDELIEKLKIKNITIKIEVAKGDIFEVNKIIEAKTLENIKEVIISGGEMGESWNSLYVKIDGDSFSVSYSDGNDFNRKGISQEIFDILNKSSVGKRNNAFNFILFIITFVLVGGIYFLISGKPTIIGGVLIIFASTYIAAKISIHYNLRRQFIFFVNKKDRPNFFIRKRDDLGVSVISTLIGFFIGYFLDK